VIYAIISYELILQKKFTESILITNRFMILYHMDFEHNISRKNDKLK
jgi:hypothetical protein